MDPRGRNAGVSQDIRQLDDIVVDPVICFGEQMPQIVRKYLRRLYPSFSADALHLRPDLSPGQALPAFGKKYLTRGGLVFPGVLSQFPA